MLHTLLFVCGSISIGYIVHTCIYWHEMHAIVPFTDSVLSGVDLLIILAIVGFVLSLL